MFYRKVTIYFSVKFYDSFCRYLIFVFYFRNFDGGSIL